MSKGGKIGILQSMSAAWLRKAMRAHDRVDTGLSGPKFSIPTNIKGEPIETRRGLNPLDNSPFYDMDLPRLFGYYSAYANTSECQYDLLYAEPIALRPEGLSAINHPSVQVQDIKVKYLPTEYRLPPSLEKHSSSAIELFKAMGRINKHPKTGVWENNDAIRLKAIENSRLFIVHDVTYFDQVSTNITLDWNSGALPNKHATIRSGIERPRQGKLPEFDTSVLANNFGTAVMFYDRHLERALVRVRNHAMGSINQRGLHCTVSGVLEVDPELPQGDYDFEFFLYGTRLEIKMETGLDPDQYLLFPVCFARELPRGGKPQLFFVAVSLVEDAEFEKSCQNADEASEYIRAKDNRFFTQDTVERSNLVEVFTYEGYAAFWYADVFVSANRDALLQLVAGKIAG